MSDLVEKLRILYGICRGELRPKTYTPVGDVDVMLEQAADRIEALETMLQFTGDADYVIANKGLLVAHERVMALEAALREILVGDQHPDQYLSACRIARRALEGKT